MNVNEQLAVKRALEVLDPLPAGLPEDALFDQVERLVSRTLPTLDRARAVRTMLVKGWLSSYTNPLNDRVYYAATDAGRLAMIAL